MKKIFRLFLMMGAVLYAATLAPVGSIHVDGLAKAHVLQHRQALVVIHGQHGVRLLQPRRGKQCIGWQRSAQAHAVFAQRFQRRRYHADFLVAQVAIFSRMRVQTGDQNMRIAQAEPSPQTCVQDGQRALQTFGRDGVGYGAQRQVRGRQRYAQPGRGQHHEQGFRSLHTQYQPGASAQAARIQTQVDRHHGRQETEGDTPGHRAGRVPGNRA